ncbi:Hypothetical protein A7982_00472 [Minicystis rosea]|nr:Hypothetical protein A7982_00472 [Minicystis rosea]
MVQVVSHVDACSSTMTCVEIVRREMSCQDSAAPTRIHG